MVLFHPPALGVGVIYWSGLNPLVEARPDLLDVIEVEPQGFWFDTRGAGVAKSANILDRVTELARPLLMHGVGLPVGGTAKPPESMMHTFAEAVRTLRPAWVSEHLSFDRIPGPGSAHTGFLLPPRQNEESVQVAVRNIRRLRDRLDVPVAFETGVNYLRPGRHEMSDGEFFAAIAEEAECGILLDLHNLYCNEKNGRTRLHDVLGALPLDRVWEVHLAGGQEQGRFYLDAHSNLVPSELMSIAAEVLPDLHEVGTLIFEIMTDYLAPNGITTADLCDQLESMHRVWALRGHRETSSQPSRPIYVRTPPNDDRVCDATTASEWETELGSLVNGQSLSTSLAELESDDGVSLLHELVTKIRAGHAVTVLPLTYRYLRHCLGRAATAQLLENFWRHAPPEPFAIEEAHNLAEYLSSVTDIPHLTELVDFELAVRDQVVDGVAKSVRFTTEPMSFLAALGRGDPPVTELCGEFVVEIR